MTVSRISNTGVLSQNSTVSKINQKLLGSTVDDLQAMSSGNLKKMSEEEVVAAAKKVQKEPKILTVDSSEIVTNIFCNTQDTITYEVNGVTFSNVEMKVCKEVVKNAIAALPVKGSDLDYKDYASMGIAVNMVNSYAKENLTQEQAAVVNQSIADYCNLLVQAEWKRQNSQGYFTDTTKGVGSTGELNTYYNVRSKLPKEAAESLKAQMANLPEQTKKLLANLEGAVQRGSVVASASNKELAAKIKSLFETIDMKEETAVNAAIAQYQTWITPVYQANGIWNTANSNSLTKALNQDKNRFVMQIANAKAVNTNVGRTIGVNV